MRAAELGRLALSVGALLHVAACRNQDTCASIASPFDGAIKKLDPGSLARPAWEAGSSQDRRAMLEALRNVMVQQCHSDHWSSAAIRCVRDMKLTDKPEKCSDLLQPPQQQHLASAAVNEWRAHPRSKDPVDLGRDPDVDKTLAKTREVTLTLQLRAAIPAWSLIEPAITSDIEDRYRETDPSGLTAEAPAYKSKTCDTSTSGSALVTFGEPTIKHGRLDKADVWCELRDHVDAFNRCYEDQLQAHPKMSGSMIVDFASHESGRPMFASVSSSTGLDRDLEWCVTTEIERAQFKPVFDNISIQLTFHRPRP